MKVTDFGIARISSQTMTTTGLALGTPAYMAPEQINGSKVDAKADQFSLGVLAYELLGHKRPFSASDDRALMYQIVESEPPPLRGANPDLPPEVEGVIRRALAKNPERRFSSCSAFVDALEYALSPAAQSTHRTARPKSGLNQQVLAIIAVVLVVAVALYVGWHLLDRYHTSALSMEAAKIAQPKPDGSAEERAARAANGRSSPDTSKARTLSPPQIDFQPLQPKSETSPEIDFQPLPSKQNDARVSGSESSKLMLPAPQRPPPHIGGRRNPIDGLLYVKIPAGSFMMGCSPGDNECASDEGSPHAVRIINAFRLGQTEGHASCMEESERRGQPKPLHWRPTPG